MTINTQIMPSTDAALLSTLHRACFVPGWDAEAMASLLAGRGTTAFIAKSGLGFAMVRCAAEEAEVLTMGVLPEGRHKGLGGALVRAVQAHARLLHGAKALFLEVSEHNAAGIALYARTGFVTVSRRKSYYRQEDGHCSDALVMRAALLP